MKVDWFVQLLLCWSFSLFLSIVSELDKNNENDQQSNSCTNQSTFISSRVFLCYVKSLLLDLPLAPDQLMGLTWKSRSIIMKVHRLFVRSPTIFEIHFHQSVSFPISASTYHYPSSSRPASVDIFSSSLNISLTIFLAVYLSYSSFYPSPLFY